MIASTVTPLILATVGAVNCGIDNPSKNNWLLNPTTSVDGTEDRPNINNGLLNPALIRLDRCR